MSLLFEHSEAKRVDAFNFIIMPAGATMSLRPRLLRKAEREGRAVVWHDVCIHHWNKLAHAGRR
jgi:hypothetical protein